MMDLLKISELKERSELGSMYNSAKNAINEIEEQLKDYKHVLEANINMDEGLNVVAESNISSSLEGLKHALHSLKTWNNMPGALKN